MPNPQARLYAPATERNRAPILTVLQAVLPERGTVLEVASGTGQHVAFFAAHFPRLVWQPSDPEPLHLESIAAWCAEAGAANILPPIAVDAAAEQWQVPRADAIVCINMIHIAPWRACLGLMAGTGKLLPEGAPLVLYGPFKQAGRHTAPSNEAFDQALRAQDPAWGVRDLEAVERAAEAQGLVLEQALPMPANNLSLILRKGR
ncbi:DUF938 domain-containing protein [Gloeobacter morelensis]|uniref:DUF938 domain-containing protein n=1 Tax=Gloeobacter morelensis MG652769 TaxID=2781736 RepID=A0ABY3PL26_9CYAN|nr:DUF938 domain-containing protein [Gloeobacter morelensis]UFP94370.1 DUF938 domain-containing protein [Gloeobacter morelensis MG652769]